MNATFAINDSFIAEQNRKAKAWLDEDYEHLGRQLRRRGVEIEELTAQAQSFKVAVPSWGVATCYSDVERAVLAYTDALVYDRGRVADDVFAALQAHLSDEEILELTYTTSLYLMHAVMSRALRVEFDDRDDPIVEVPAPAGYDPMSMFEER